MADLDSVRVPDAPAVNDPETPVNDKFIEPEPEAVKLCPLFMVSVPPVTIWHILVSGAPKPDPQDACLQPEAPLEWYNIRVSGSTYQIFSPSVSPFPSAKLSSVTL